MLLSRLRYIIPHRVEDAEDYSLFQGYSRPILRIGPFIEQILKLPPDFVELYVPHARAMTLRLAGTYGYHIVPVQFDALPILPLRLEMPFLIFFSDEETASDTTDFLNTLPQPVLHVSTASGFGDLPLEKLNRSKVRAYVRQVAKYLEGHVAKEDLEKLHRIIDRKSRPPSRKATLRQSMHYSTLPNEAALTSMHFELGKVDPLPDIVAWNGDPNELEVDRSIYERVVASALTVRSLRTRHVATHGTRERGPKLDLLIAAPSIYRHHFALRSRYIFDAEKKLDAVNKRAFRKALNFFVGQKTIRYTGEPSDIEEVFSSPAFRMIASERKAELFAFAASVAVKAADAFVPALRLGPAINLLHSDLKSIGECSRTAGPHHLWKLNRLVRQLSARMQRTIPNDFEQFLTGQDSPIKLVCDVPLEWMRVRNLPLMICHSVSRIPSTPGNLMTQQCLVNEPLTVPIEEACRVLVIRSFEEEDPIRTVFEDALKRWELRDRVDFVDVRSKAELIDALLRNNYFILIYDGHGSHGVKSDVGGIIVGDEDVDIWSLRSEASVPPIVLLSACDTHPLDRSHASTANGFISLGAMTVLGTLLPVKASHSADFLARLLDLIIRFVPETVGDESFLERWDTFVTRSQRLAFFAEFYEALLIQIGAQPSQERWIRVHERIDRMIVSGSDNWWVAGIAAIAKEHEISDVAVLNFLKNDFFYTESINYIQIGNPELISLHSKRYRDENPALVSQQSYATKPV